jgi:hypothetical protein
MRLEEDLFEVPLDALPGAVTGQRLPCPLGCLCGSHELHPSRLLVAGTRHGGSDAADAYRVPDEVHDQRGASADEELACPRAQ